MADQNRRRMAAKSHLLLGLPTELLEKILSPLPLTDRLAFSAACDNRKLEFPPYSSPHRLLLYTGEGNVGEEGKKLWNFLDTSTGTTYRCNFPGVSGARLYFSKEGWLFLSESENPSSLFLFNPLTGQKVVSTFIHFDFFTGRRIFEEEEGGGACCGAGVNALGTFYLTGASVNFNLNLFRLFDAFGNWDILGEKRGTSEYQSFLAFWPERFYYLLFVPKNGDGAISAYELSADRRRWIAVKNIGCRRFFLVKKGALCQDPAEMETMEEVGKAITLPAPGEKSDGDMFYCLQEEEFYGDGGGGGAAAAAVASDSSVCMQGIWVEHKWGSGSD